jgi:AhpD family alkylhydroperoxidase
MKPNPVETFNAYRTKMNEKILASDSRTIKRIFNLDANTFRAGALDAQTKELLGLVASTVLRCDDCIKYHLGKCHELKIEKAAIFETLEIATLIGGTIVIPHLRKAYEYWEFLENNSAL